MRTAQVGTQFFDLPRERHRILLEDSSTVLDTSLVLDGVAQFQIEASHLII